MEGALDVFSNAFSAGPSPEVCAGLGECLFLSGQTEAALQACNLALDMAPNNPQAYSVRLLAIAKIPDGTNIYAGTKQPLELEMTKSSAESQLAAARSSIVLKQYTKAVSLLSSAIATHPNCWRAFYYRSVAFTNLGDRAGADEDRKQMDAIAGSNEKPSGDIGTGYNIDAKAVCRQFPDTATMIGHFTNQRIGTSRDAKNHAPAAILRQCSLQVSTHSINSKYLYRSVRIFDGKQTLDSPAPPDIRSKFRTNVDKDNAALVI